ncbi:MAG: nucleotidyltransferase family protein [Caldilineaceae bacterium]|nr:nucleotidyltransferase family protein [Caldilineaceae bacterium]
MTMRQERLPHNQAELRRILREQLPTLMNRYGVTSLGIFGSTVRGEATKESDIDVLVEIDNPQLTLFQFIELRDYLSDLLGVAVDLVEKETLKPALRKQILHEVELL